MENKRILVLCTGNSCRSQMAEGFLKHYKPSWQIYSAGISPKGINNLAIKVMEEEDIDISKQASDSIDKYLVEDFDYVITVCDKAKEACPVFLNAKEMMHWGFKDPADAKGSPDEVIKEFRLIRDEIKEKIVNFLNDK